MTPFRKIDPTTVKPPRQWALCGYPGSGKSTFAAQMAGPLLVIDSDHRFVEVAALAGGDVYELSPNPVDHIDPRRIAELLRQGMPGAGVQTIVVDSLTSIITPMVMSAMMANDAGENKNRIGAFREKALGMRLLQDAVTGWGAATLWVYHFRDARDAKANSVQATTVSAVELARLRRSLNMQLSVVQEGANRGIRVDWARRGRSGAVLWDDSGAWRGMPDRIEAAVYGGLTVAEQERISTAEPTGFAGRADAIAWAFEKGCFRDAVHAENAYEALKRAKHPGSAVEMWSAWINEVNLRCQAEQAERVAA